jgi:hypothetical protein
LVVFIVRIASPPERCGLLIQMGGGSFEALRLAETMVASVDMMEDEVRRDESHFWAPASPKILPTLTGTWMTDGPACPVKDD